MASAVFTETILIISSVIVASTLSITILSQTGTFQSTFESTSENLIDVSLTKIKIIYATNSSSNTIQAWVKNVGITPITTVNSTDVYFGNLGNVTRIPFDTDITSYWEYNTPLSVWKIKDTIQINIFYDTPVMKNTNYILKIVAPNGVTDEHIFSIP